MVGFFVVHSHSITKTPKLINTSFRAKGHSTSRLIVPSRNWSSRPQIGRDFFTFYPATADPATTVERQVYAKLFDFASSNKFLQRQKLGEMGFNVPWSLAEKSGDSEATAEIWEDFKEDHVKALVRPLRHMKRQGFQPVGQGTDLPIDFIEGQQYITGWINIQKEYRTIFVEGTAVATFYKSERPWKLTKLDRWPGLNERWTLQPIFRMASAMAVDYALEEDSNWPLVLEVNFAPGLSPKNIERVVTQFLANKGA